MRNLIKNYFTHPSTTSRRQFFLTSVHVRSRNGGHWIRRRKWYFRRKRLPHPTVAGTGRWFRQRRWRTSGSGAERYSVRYRLILYNARFQIIRLKPNEMKWKKNHEITSGRVVAPADERHWVAHLVRVVRIRQTGRPDIIWTTRNK